MEVRYCGMCGTQPKALSSLFLPGERKIIEMRWCPHCGSLGIRERGPDSTVHESWEAPKAVHELVPELNRDSDRPTSE